MNILLIGGAGRVGAIVWPALSAQHNVRCYDLRPIEGSEDRCIIDTVLDEPALAKAMTAMDVVVYMAMGRQTGPREYDTATAFEASVRGVYHTFHAGLELGIRRFVYISTLSVYKLAGRTYDRCTEERPANAWEIYGATKRLGETVCAMAVQEAPDASVLVLRLFVPTIEADYHGWRRYDPARPRESSPCTGPNDTRRLFLAAVQFNQPGYHIVQTSGDTTGVQFPHDRARALLNWEPRGE